MEEVFFSVIVPVYNVEKYLDKCIESVLCQTFQDFELILVDDGSPDKSGAICDEYNKLSDAVKVIHKTNGGLSDARNCGVEIARGKYVIFLDSDDYLKDDVALGVLYDRAANFDDDLILYSSINVYKDNVHKQRYGDYEIPPSGWIEKEDLLNDLYRHNNFPGAAWICCVKKKLLLQNNITFPLGVTGEDYIWILQVLEASDKIGLSNEAVVMHLMDSPGSITSRPRLSGIKGICLCLRHYLANHKTWPVGIRNHMAYVFLVGMFTYARLKGSDRATAHNLLSQVRSVLAQSTDIRHKAIFLCSSIIGLSLTSRIIALLRR